MRKAERTSVKTLLLQSPVMYLSCSKMSNAMRTELWEIMEVVHLFERDPEEEALRSKTIIFSL